ncbi:hypothetical protein ACFU3J_32835 [Streptomyces sp. NPDC057411]|uniref:hypothetical protein n=1 Tax=unclassified Streptomyces TaxID=2593676 RepID=UPI00362CE594
MAGGNGGGGELFSLVWGLGATGFGWVVATDFRGAARRLYRLQAERSARTLWAGPRLGVGFLRAVAGVFAVVGPITLAGAVRRLAGGEQLTVDTARLPAPVIGVVALVGAFTVWSVWRPAGFVRRAWDTGAPVQRAAALVHTAGVGGFLVGMGLGLQALMMCGWLVGAGAGIVMLVGHRAGHGTPSADG